MKIYKLPTQIETIIFDIDSTLYTNAEYATEQVDIQIRYFADLKGISHQVARKQIQDYKYNWECQHNGQKLSLANTLVAFGIPIEQSIIWRQQLLEPADFLCKDTLLQKTLKLLSQRFKLICVTNNPVLPAKKTLEVLGVADLFKENLIGLDTCGVSKPHSKPFLLAAERTNTSIPHCISIGDRYHIDIELPLEMGMGAILVDGVKDVYSLPELLK